MPLITLTTDYGTKDHYTGALKGQLYSANKDIIIVDINHEIPAFDLIPAAFIMKNACPRFPENTIHIALINIRDGNSRFLVVKRKESYYIVPDNGLICMMFPNHDFEAFAYKGLDKEFSFTELHSAVSTMIYAISTNQLMDICVPITSFMVLSLLKPYTQDGSLKGAVIYIDNYSNIVTNISKSIFEDFIGEHAYTILLRQNRIRKISKHYADVDEGMALALFNDDDYLEIAISKGNASGLLGLQYGQPVLVEISKT